MPIHVKTDPEAERRKAVAAWPSISRKTLLIICPPGKGRQTYASIDRPA